MGWREALEPARMNRVAVVAPTDRLRTVLVAVADAGVVQLERIGNPVSGPATEALERIRRQIGLATAPNPESVAPLLVPDAPDLAQVERSRDLGVLAGESELEEVGSSAVRSGAVTAFVGWSPTTALPRLADRLTPLGGAVVPLPVPRGAEPPTLLQSEGATGTFQPLVDTYTTLPYADVNPAAFAGLAYVMMFGMMFGDVGRGALLVAAGLVLSTGRPAAFSRFRHLSPFIIGAGLAGMLFGLAFGEAFGPTHLVPTVWLAPLDRPTTLLAVAIAVGAGLLAVSYGFGTVNRWREGGAARALVATSGLAGAALYLGLATAVLGWYWHSDPAVVAGGVLAASGLVLAYVGCYAEAGLHAGSAAQAGIQTFDAVLRIGTNTISFARLAAFGLIDVALGGIIWTRTTELWHRGPALWLIAAVVFLIGNAVAFALESLVAGVQALRLEYYELFSRIFVAEGRPFRPWLVPTLTLKETPCSPG